MGLRETAQQIGSKVNDIFRSAGNFQRETEHFAPGPRNFDRPKPLDQPALALPQDPTLTLVNRTTCGFTPEMHQEATSRGWDDYIEWQLDHENIPEHPELAGKLAAYDVLNAPANLIYINYVGGAQQVFFQLVEATLLRQVYSTRQLYERMVEFWSDHFSIDILAGTSFALKPVDDREVIRQHALGTFPDLLRASAHSPAMLFYLDNYLNFVGRPQENYARELMELHSLGVDGGYTQDDVEEVARCFTGWSIEPPTSPNFGSFRYVSFLHDNGPKTVLGQTIPAGGGKADGDRVLDILAYHPSTAWYVSRKMCRWFLAHEPDDGIVEKVASTYLRTGGDIKEMLRAILRYPNFVQYARPKYKRPFHHLVGLLRVLHADITNPRNLIYALYPTGHVPFNWRTPDGTPDELDSWATNVLPRWSTATGLLYNGLPGTAIDLDSWFPDQPGSEGVAMNTFLTGGFIPPWEEQLLQDFFDQVQPQVFNVRSAAIREAVILAASSPSYQWY